MKKLLFAALVGAALMWFYDPANGTQRRDALQRTLQGTPRAAGTHAPLVAEDATRADVPTFATR